MTEDEVFLLDQHGLIPGPNETLEQYTQRALAEKEKFEQGDWIPKAHWDYPTALLQRLFHVKPLYICAFYSNQNLTPWQGAATWIQDNRVHSIQLKQAFAKGSFLFYNREELLAHEAVHAARSAFNEPRFEEYFAYMTSEKKYRQVLGPIFRKPWEVWPLFLTAIFGFYTLSLTWLTYLLIRLIHGHRILTAASQNALLQTQDKALARALLFRMTDEEIAALARGEKIASYVAQRHDLRWKIMQRYYDANNSCARSRVEIASQSI